VCGGLNGVFDCMLAQGGGPLEGLVGGAGMVEGGMLIKCITKY
jgi:hypothetical protein